MRQRNGQLLQSGFDGTDHKRQTVNYRSQHQAFKGKNQLQVKMLQQPFAQTLLRTKSQQQIKTQNRGRQNQRHGKDGLQDHFKNRTCFGKPVSNGQTNQQ